MFENEANKTMYEKYLEHKTQRYFVGCFVFGLLALLFFFLLQFVMFSPYIVFLTLTFAIGFVRCRAEVIACKRIAEYDKREWEKLPDVNLPNAETEGAEETEK